MPLTIIQTPPNFPLIARQSNQSGLQHLRSSLSTELPCYLVHVADNVRVEARGIPRGFREHLGLPTGEETDSHGSIYIATNSLYWFEANESAVTSRGFAIDYPSIILHAIRRCGDSQEGACVYLQIHLDSYLTTDGDSVPLVDHRSNNTDDDEYDGAPVCELFIYPANGAEVDEMFQALNECAGLHPEPEADSDSGEDDEAGGGIDGGQWIRLGNDSDADGSETAPDNQEYPEPSSR